MFAPELHDSCDRPRPVTCDGCGADVSRARLLVVDERPVLPLVDPDTRTARYCSPACLVLAWWRAASSDPEHAAHLATLAATLRPVPDPAEPAPAGHAGTCPFRGAAAVELCAASCPRAVCTGKAATATTPSTLSA